MRMVKAIAFAVVICFSVDVAFWGGAYRRELGRDIRDSASYVGSLNWHGLNGGA